MNDQPPVAEPGRDHPVSTGIRAMTVFHIYHAWSQANPVFTRLCEGKFNITRREWRILATLVTHPPLSSSALARAASLDAARTSRALTSLTQKGWVVRERAAKNARSVIVQATDQGKALYHRLLPEVTQLNALITQDLTAGELETLQTMLGKIAARGQALQQADIVKERSHRGLARRPSNGLPNSQ
ncbi:MAG: MarR family winged helix-turn-helix transcriptional regulator [Burkholderiaceae bacterium]